MGICVYFHHRAAPDARIYRPFRAHFIFPDHVQYATLSPILQVSEIRNPELTAAPW